VPRRSRCSRALRNLRRILARGEAQARERGIGVDDLLALRVIDDMPPLSRQVRIACDMAKNGAARPAGLQPPVFENDETALAQLYARVEHTLAFVEASTRPRSTAARRARSCCRCGPAGCGSPGRTACRPSCCPACTST